MIDVGQSVDPAVAARAFVMLNADVREPDAEEAGCTGSCLADLDWWTAASPREPQQPFQWLERRILLSVRRLIATRRHKAAGKWDDQ